jgi:signal transduction protein with GAF and PtsI domain
MSEEAASVEIVLRAVAHRVAAIDRLEPPADDPLLVAVTGLAVTVLETQAASIALHDPATDRLVFRAASGPAAGDIVGMAIDAAAGIAGYAFSTGQPLAVADVTADPRFERSVAEATGYIPSSLLAVPLLDERGTIGVLEALDRHGGTFTLRDLDVASALAGVATLAVRHGQRRRDATAVLAGSLSDLVAGGTEPPDGDAIDALVSRVTSGLADEDDPTWLLADRIARLRDADPDAMRLATEWLDALIGYSETRRGPGHRRGPT